MVDYPVPDTSGWPTLGPVESNSYRVSDHLVDMRRASRRTRSMTLPALPQALLLEPERSALIVVDMQNDFCATDGWLASVGVDTAPARALAQPINRVSEAFREQSIPVIWVNWGIRADRTNLSPGTRHPFNPNGRGPGLGGEFTAGLQTYKVLTEGSWGARLIDELVAAPTDLHVSKHRISGFWDTPLDSMLRNLGVTTLFFAGVNTDHCVLGTLMDANFHGYDTILLEDCTGTTSPEFCFRATLHNVRFCFGFTATSADLVSALSAL